MKLKTVKDIDLKGKTVLYRAPYDIDVEDVGGKFELADDSRIRVTLPTLQYLIKEECKIVILTYVKRPNGKVVERWRTGPHANRLGDLLSRPIDKVDDCVGEYVEEKIKNMKSGDILMLENVRFHTEEMIDNDDFAKELCRGKDIIVFDGFPQAHRRHSSTTGILRHLPAVAGLYFEEEVTKLSSLIENPSHPFTVIVGGAKISDKVDAINNLLHKADTILVGGAVANVFLKSQGKELGDSFIEDVFVHEAKREKKDWVFYAGEIIKNAERLGKKVIYPIDLVIYDGFTAKIIDINTSEVPKGWKTLDIGPRTVDMFRNVISESKTVFMNGPLGKFENNKFAVGSKSILEAMKDIKGETIIAGGDTIDLVHNYGNAEDYSYMSLAGGAALEFLAGKELPVLKALQ